MHSSDLKRPCAKYWKDKKKRLDTNPRLKEDIEHFIRYTSGTTKTLHTSHYWFTTYLVFFIFSFLSIIFSLLQQSAAYSILMIGLCIVPLVFSVALLSVAHYLLDKDIELQKERGDYLLVFSLIISVFIVLFLLIYAYLGVLRFSLDRPGHGEL